VLRQHLLRHPLLLAGAGGMTPLSSATRNAMAVCDARTANAPHPSASGSCLYFSSGHPGCSFLQT
jgi:hypothetical protein